MDDVNNLQDGLTPDPSPKERGAKPSPGYMTVDNLKAKELIQLGKNNRKGATLSETILWNYIRNRKLGEKFRRQHAIGAYIPDFVCLEKRLIVEVDGDYHNTPQQMELDENRTLELEQKHLFKVIRFRNEEVLKDINTVLEKIKTALSERRL
ncbi:endonuclease domain-containing protein [Flavobacterium hauense]